jgi:uncharacterized membrane protein YfcA
MLTASLLGIAIGIVMGLTGAGGGILAVPALTVVLGFDLPTAAPVALVAVGLAALLGAIDGLRRGLVRYKAATLMAVVGGIVSPLGIWVAARVPGPWLLILFGLVMIYVACRGFQQACRPARLPDGYCDDKVCMLSPASGKLIWNGRSGMTLAAIGAASGFFTGLLGVGGGFIIVPALQRYSNVSMHGIVSTSLMVIGLVSAVTVGHAISQGLQWPAVLTWFVVFALVGMLAGRALSPHMPARALRAAFAAVCLVVAVIMLAKGLGAGITPPG